MTTILPLSNFDAEAIETLLDAAFGADRRGRTAYKLRAGVGMIPELCFAMIQNGRLIGSIQCWPVVLAQATTRHPLVLVGPVAVVPAAQGTGIGQALMKAMLGAATLDGYDALMMIGDPDYYGRFFGFTAALTTHWEMPGPVERDRLLARIDRDGGVPDSGILLPDTGFALRDRFA
jgi:predicted N-acetyltransferase YhbS